MSQLAPKYLPSDVIAGMLAYVNASNFTGHPKCIHETVYKLRKRFPVFKAFAFSTNDIYPFSRKLEKVLFTLQRARIIGMENPDFEKFVIKENGKKYINDVVLKKFTPTEQKELRKAGKQFGTMCKAY